MGLLRAGLISVFPDSAIALQAIAPLDRREERPRSGLGYAEGLKHRPERWLPAFGKGRCGTE